MILIRFLVFGIKAMCVQLIFWSKCAKYNIDYIKQKFTRCGCIWNRARMTSSRWNSLNSIWVISLVTIQHQSSNLLKKESSPTLTKYYWVMQFISHGKSSFHKASFEIELGLLDFNMVSEPSLGYWTDLPLYYGPHVWLVRHTWGGILKRESSPTLTKNYWVVQFISHGQS